ncbi:MAG: class I SAM-dependent methyltransferase [Acidobacteria bacterium]|nr:class I SAM-dependent methyltransferase [Acidobacteriota bacterium]
MSAIYQKVKGLVPLSFRVFVATRTRRLADRASRLDRSFLATKYLRGEGIEIGALHTPLPVPHGAKVKYVDRMSVSDLRRQYPELASLPLVEADIIDDGEHLSNVAAASQDFVIANHFIEHCQNPLDALTNMFRVLRAGGVLYMAIPDKRYTFDVDRPITSIEHVVRDFDEGPAWSRQQHFEEWTKFVDKVADETEAARHVSDLMEKDYSIHFHAWTQAEMFELFATLKRKQGLSFDVEMFLKHAGECVFILRKTDESPS